MIIGLLSICYDMVFFMLSVCYDMMFFIVLLRRFICMKTIQIGKTYSINRKYHIIVIRILKKLTNGYSDHYIIKFISFMSLYYSIYLDFISLFIIFSNLYIESIYV